jgi:hypothetical protein
MTNYIGKHTLSTTLCPRESQLKQKHLNFDQRINSVFSALQNTGGVIIKDVDTIASYQR